MYRWFAWCALGAMLVVTAACDASRSSPPRAAHAEAPRGDNDLRDRAEPTTSPPAATTAQNPPMNTAPEKSDPSVEPRTVIVAGGCFWCVEAVFAELNGVLDVVSGYIGGTVENPTYEQVCSGATGHAEACRITYDPRSISYEKLLEIFFRTHDPTTLNRQGNDWGTQYRSAIFVQSPEERAVCERIIAALNQSQAYPAPVVTSLESAGTFYLAEDYHQDYFRKNPTNGYCRAVIPPKLDKLKKAFAEQLKPAGPQ